MSPRVPPPRVGCGPGAARPRRRPDRPIRGASRRGTRSGARSSTSRAPRRGSPGRPEHESARRETAGRLTSSPHRRRGTRRPAGTARALRPGHAGSRAERSITFDDPPSRRIQQYGHNFDASAPSRSGGRPPTPEPPGENFSTHWEESDPLCRAGAPCRRSARSAGPRSEDRGTFRPPAGRPRPSVLPTSLLPPLPTRTRRARGRPPEPSRLPARRRRGSRREPRGWRPPKIRFAAPRLDPVYRRARRPGARPDVQVAALAAARLSRRHRRRVDRAGPRPGPLPWSFSIAWALGLARSSPLPELWGAADTWRSRVQSWRSTASWISRDARPLPSSEAGRPEDAEGALTPHQTRKSRHSSRQERGVRKCLFRRFPVRQRRIRRMWKERARLPPPARRFNPLTGFRTCSSSPAKAGERGRGAANAGAAPATISARSDRKAPARGVVYRGTAPRTADGVLDDLMVIYQAALENAQVLAPTDSTMSAAGQLGGKERRLTTPTGREEEVTDEPPGRRTTRPLHDGRPGPGSPPTRPRGREGLDATGEARSAQAPPRPLGSEGSRSPSKNVEENGGSRRLACERARTTHRRKGVHE